MTLSTPSEQSDKGKKRIFLFRLILASFFIVMLLVIIFLIAEIGFRKSGKYALSGFQLDDLVIWKVYSGICENRKNEEGMAFELKGNREGFRGKEWAKKKEKKRIMVLGDSFTAALDFPDDQTFTGILQAKLDSDSATKNQYEVINISAPAWSIDQEVLMFEKYATQLQPAYLILMASPNDVREAYCKKFITSNGAGSVTIHAPVFALKRRLGWYFSNHSATFQYLQQTRFHSNYGSFDDLFEMYKMNFGVEDIGDWDRPLYLKKNLPEVNAAYVLYQTLLERLKNDCTAHNCQLLFSLNPVHEYVQEVYLADTLLDPGKVLVYFQSICDKRNVPFLNLYEPAMKLSNTSSLYMKQDFHYSSFGHLFTGSGLYRFFVGQLSKK